MKTAEISVMEQAQRIIAQVRQVIVGKDQALLWVLAVMLAKGHILLEVLMLVAFGIGIGIRAVYR